MLSFLTEAVCIQEGFSAQFPYWGVHFGGLHAVLPRDPCSSKKAQPTELTSSLTLAAGEWSLALLLTWLLLPFSRSRRDLSFSASNS